MDTAEAAEATQRDITTVAGAPPGVPATRTFNFRSTCDKVDSTAETCSGVGGPHPEQDYDDQAVYSLPGPISGVAPLVLDAVRLPHGSPTADVLPDTKLSRLHDTGTVSPEAPPKKKFKIESSCGDLPLPPPLDLALLTLP